MKVTSMILAAAVCAMGLAGPSAAAPSYGSSHKAAGVGAAHHHVAYKRERRVKIKRPERPSCYAWPGGCTGM